MAVFGQDRSGSNDLFYRYGMIIGPGGDFDGDGYDDLLVQGPPIALTNTATLVRGGPGRTSISIESAFDNPDRMLPIDLGDFRIVNLGGGKVGRVGRIGIGAPAGGGGDVNGDGLGDLVFQSKHTDSGGFMHILLGRRGDDGYLDLDEELPLAEGGNDLGWTVGGAPDFQISNNGEGFAGIVGDLNGDGYDDAAVGMPLADVAERGKVAVVFGSPTPVDGLTWADLAAGNGGFVLEGRNDGEHFGRSIAAGDIDGDGLSDLLIGAPFAPGPDGQARAGRVEIVYGRDFSGLIDRYGGADDDVFDDVTSDANYVGGRGNDTLVGRVGATVLYGGAGDDELRIARDEFLRLDGGLGEDTLVFFSVGNRDLDLLSVGRRLRGIERFVLQNPSMVLNVSALEVSRLSDTSNRLIVTGQGGPRVTAEVGDAWVDEGEALLDGVPYYVLSTGKVELWLDQRLETSIPPSALVTQVSIDENTPGESLVVAGPAVDPDGNDAALRYTLLDDSSGGLFEMDPNSGNIFVVPDAVLDFEAGQAPYTLTYSVTDEDGLNIETSLQITLNDVNEPPIMLTQDPAWSAEEGSPSLLGGLAAEDLDLDDTVTWSLITNPDGLFEIDPDTGDVYLRDGELLNFEQTSRYAIVARATDTAGLFAETSVDLAVLDLDKIEETIRLQFDYRKRSVWENGSAEGWAGIRLPGFDPAIHPFACMGGTNVATNNEFVSNFAQTFPDLGTTLGVLAVPFEVRYQQDGTLCFFADIEYKSGSWSASLPTDVSLTFPDEVRPGDEIVISSDYSRDWQRASLWGDTPGLYLATKVEANEFFSSLTISEDVFDSQESITVGPITDERTDEIGARPIRWVGVPSENRLEMPAPIRVQTKDFAWDFSNAIALILSRLGQPAHVGTVQLDFDDYDGYAELKYTLFRSDLLYSSDDRYDFSLSEAPIVYDVFGIAPMIAHLTLEDESEHAFVVGSPYSFELKSDVDRNSDGLIDVEISFESWVDAKWHHDQYVELGIVTWAGKASLNTYTPDGELFGRRSAGPYLERSCGVTQTLATLAVAAGGCIPFAGDTRYVSSHRSWSSTVLQGRMQISTSP